MRVYRYAYIHIDLYLHRCLHIYFMSFSCFQPKRTWVQFHVATRTSDPEMHFRFLNTAGIVPFLHVMHPCFSVLPLAWFLRSALHFATVACHSPVLHLPQIADRWKGLCHSNECLGKTAAVSAGFGLQHIGRPGRRFKQWFKKRRTGRLHFMDVLRRQNWIEKKNWQKQNQSTKTSKFGTAPFRRKTWCSHWYRCFHLECGVYMCIFVFTVANEDLAMPSYSYIISWWNNW